MSDEGISINLILNPEDISSYSNFDKILQKEMEIFATLDFEKKIFSGYIITTYIYLDKTINYLILDLKGPEIEKIEYLQNNNVYPLNFQIHYENENKDILGTPLIINLPIFPENEIPDELRIKIFFTTNENCSGIFFLDKEQTESKKYNFMFTKCKSIECRSLFPCQDTPFAKVTIEANLEIESPYKFLFSGIQKGLFYNSNTKKYNFFYRQSIPIPTYLISFVCGNLEYKKLSNRCGIFSEKELIDKGKNEFENIENYLQNIESFVNRYYDLEILNILILPFSYPFDKIENPNLIFIPQSLISNDKSLSSEIIQEIIHSFIGNLITNKNWKNLWINEGLVKYIERKIIGIIYGEDMENFENLFGFENLISDIEKIGEESILTSLEPDLFNINPNDYFSSIPCEKGFEFLYYLESLVGKENFQLIIQIYIDKYKYQSIDYLSFKEIYENFILENTEGNDGKEILNSIDWVLWINSSGKPFAEFNFKSNLSDDAINLCDKILGGKGNLDDKKLFVNWNNNVKLYFLKYLIKNYDEINGDIYNNIKNIFGFEKDYYNMEVMNLWFQLSLKVKAKDCINGVKKFVLESFRLKYIEPIYSFWFEFQPKEAKDFFEKNKEIYPLIVRQIISNKFKS